MGLLLAACETGEPALSRGGAGESCTARADCEEDLACFDNRCLTRAVDDRDNDAGTAPLTETRGAAGESCARRADCNAGLHCIATVCVEHADTSTMSTPLGDRGESCQARNDCAMGLACIMNRCVTGENKLAVHAKQCFRVQCELDEDCCKNFVAPLNCPTWKMTCASGDMAACTQFNASCMCALQCQNSACVPARKCSANSDCVVANERCFSGVCAQCASDTDCTMPGQHCINAVCRPGCERNEQCPVFHECKSNLCVEVGCRTDRECYFATKSPLARCADGACLTPCTSDAQCPELQACHEQRCTFVGCESDEECRVLLNVAGQAGNDRAVCRLPDR